jgi:hypothetical protein
MVGWPNGDDGVGDRVVMEGGGGGARWRGGWRDTATGGRRCVARHRWTAVVAMPNLGWGLSVVRRHPSPAIEGGRTGVAVRQCPAVSTASATSDWRVVPEGRSRVEVKGGGNI